MRQLAGRLKQRAKTASFPEVLLSAVSLVYGGLVIFYARSLFESSQRYGILFLGLSLTVAIITTLKGKHIYPLAGRWNYVVVVTFIAMAMAVTLYFYSQFPVLVYERAGVKNTLDYVMGAMALFLVVEVTRAKMGAVVPLMVIAFWLYAYFGPYFPGQLRHAGLSVTRILEVSGAELDGIFGSMTQTCATVIAIFVFWSGLISGFGGMNLVLRVARFIGRKSTRFICQTAVLGSLAFGMFSGSAMANAAVVGGLTIPMMKKYGVPPAFAAAIESVASTGGQVMPPVLGASVFFMMDFLNMRYLAIMLVAFVPAIIFYACVALVVDVKGRKYVSQAAVSEALATPQTSDTKAAATPVYKAIPIIASLVMLFVAMAGFNMEVLVAGFFTISAYLSTELVLELVVARGRPFSGILAFARGVLNGLREGSLGLATMGAMVACMAIIMKVMVATVLAQKLSFAMVDLAGGSLLLLMLLVLVVCILLGMAVATVAVYILVAMLAAPALVDLGVVPIAAHFAVFYWAILAGITPPVAPVCVVTSLIGKSSYVRTCWESCKLGVPIFLLPFVFLAQPGLLTLDFSETPQAFFVTLLGMASVSLGLSLPTRNLAEVAKGIMYLVLGALALFYPWSIIKAVVLALIVAIIAFELLDRVKRLIHRGKKALA